MRTGAAGAGAGAAAAVAAGEGGAGAGGAADSDSEDSSVLAFAQEAPVLENGGAYEEVGMPGSHDSDDMAAARVLAASFIPRRVCWATAELGAGKQEKAAKQAPPKIAVSHMKRRCGRCALRR